VTNVAASAPGKIILCGEYAVLEGAPALCMAVNRRARAAVGLAQTGLHTVRTVGYCDGEWRFRSGEGGVFEWVGTAPPGGLDLLQQIYRTAGVAGSFDIELDTGDFVDAASRAKLGLGSSAALTVALVTALYRATGQAGGAAGAAEQAHRQYQQGRGSGIDIAASINGGVIEYRMQNSAACRSVEWPVGLEYAVLWSGRPASTRDKLRVLNEVGHGVRQRASAALLKDAAEEVAETWGSGKPAELLAAFRPYIDALTQFDVDHNLGIFDAGHGELAEAAAKQRLVYKPCGAGGGDAGIVLATDRGRMERFTRLAAESGFQMLDIALEPRGALFED
jgi:phosphomevalonate kinase